MENYASMDRKFLELGMRLQHAREPEVTISVGEFTIWGIPRDVVFVEFYILKVEPWWNNITSKVNTLYFSYLLSKAEMFVFRSLEQKVATNILLATPR